MFKEERYGYQVNKENGAGRGLKWNEVSDVEHMWEGAKEVVVTNTREVPLLWLGERT